MRALFAPLLAVVTACAVPSTVDPGPSGAEGGAEGGADSTPRSEEELETAPTPKEEPETAAGETVEQPGTLEISVGGVLRLPTSFAPPRGRSMLDEPRINGWSAATGEFSYCVDDGGAVCKHCEFLRPDAPPDHVETGEDCQRPTKAQVMKARVEDGGFAVVDGSWAFGAEVILVVEEGQGQADDNGDPRGLVEIGARLRAPDAALAWLARVESCERYDGVSYCAPVVHVDAIAPSADGRTIAVLAHTFAGEFSDTYPIHLLDAVELAAAAHNAEGLAQLRAGRFDAAAGLFERVAAIDEAGWKGPYNLACALAQAGADPRQGTDDSMTAVRVALEEAIRRGGDSVRVKAAKDPDLDGVRSEPWFDSL